MRRAGLVFLPSAEELQASSPLVLGSDAGLAGHLRDAIVGNSLVVCCTQSIPHTSFSDVDKFM